MYGVRLIGGKEERKGVRGRAEAEQRERERGVGERGGGRVFSLTPGAGDDIGCSQSPKGL